MFLVNVYTILAIGVVLLLFVLYMVLYIMNKKTPVPKGCEHLQISDENCSSCTNTECSIKNGLDIEKINEEIKNEKEQSL
jgi:hypothetical protein